MIAWIKSNGKGVLKTATVNSGTGDITFSSEFEWADTPSESEVEPLGDFDIVNYDGIIDYGVASTEKIVIVFQGDDREPKGVVVTESGGSFTKSTEEDMFDTFDMHPNDMNFKVYVSGKDGSFSNEYFNERLQITTSNSIESSIPGKSLKSI